MYSPLLEEARADPRYHELIHREPSMVRSRGIDTKR